MTVRRNSPEAASRTQADDNVSGKITPGLMRLIAALLFIPIIIVVAASAIITHLPPPAPVEPSLTAIVNDDFETFSLDWWLGHGWAHAPIPGGGSAALLVTEGGDPTRFGGGEYSDVIVEARFRVEAGEGRLYVRYSPAGSYAVLIDPAGGVRLYRNADLLGQVQPEAGGPDWHTVRLSAIGSALHLAVDGVERLAVTDPAPEPLPPGIVALDGAGDPVRVYVDNFTLWIPAG